MGEIFATCGHQVINWVDVTYDIEPDNHEGIPGRIVIATLCPPCYEPMRDDVVLLEELQ